MDRHLRSFMLTITDLIDRPIQGTLYP